MQKFGVDKKCLHGWIAGEVKKGNKRAKQIGSGRTPFRPCVEAKLFKDVEAQA